MGAGHFAFGAVLYELLTGERVFEGETVTETIAAVLKSEPDWEKLPSDTPWRIKELLSDSLQKEMRERPHDISHARIQINKALNEPTTPSPIGVSVAQRPQRLWATVVVVVVLTAVATGLVIWSLMRSSSDVSRSATRFVINPPSGAPLANSTGSELAISPDGTQIVYQASRDGTTQLYIRSLEGLAATPIPGTEDAGVAAFFSPNGESIAFSDPRKAEEGFSFGWTTDHHL